ncbi:GNAT family N-acetyltransferase [Nocardioides marmorisolisilvae]|uniref:GNAT family N-acetyltransferase n=1 Tax=Nocardioides marmorisolisilvae TaxID=1542737 RepID=A0A3N0DSF4_9ACTN|nr:GNAT family N-acetyltransferase [Nocardioides marmorisolisilvae]RNL78552.1 GNAT family N-acetyltransferase [Nocardioides marmorisolisilvae]
MDPRSRVPTLTDGVVTLRAHTDDDVESVLEQSLDPASLTWTNIPIGYTRDDVKRYVRELLPGGWETGREWAFAVEVAGTYAATVLLRDEGEGRAEIAYAAHPRSRGTGSVDRALRLLLAWGFSPESEGGRGLRTVIWRAFVGNWASRKTAWRLGFSCDGTVRDAMVYRDTLVDGWIGTLLATDELAPRNAWLDVPRIVGADVVLRAHAEHDAERAQQACSDERTAYWLGSLPTPYTLEDAEAYVRSRPEGMATGTALHWAIADPATDDLLGSISIMDLTGQAGPEVGYWAHPDARGRGVMTAAVRLAVRHAFIDEVDGGLGLDKLRLVSAVDNTASRRVAEANGFREGGIERLGTVCRDGRHDTVVYDLVPADLRVS